MRMIPSTSDPVNALGVSGDAVGGLFVTFSKRSCGVPLGFVTAGCTASAMRTPKQGYAEARASAQPEVETASCGDPDGPSNGSAPLATNRYS